jgi:hypothetical protein
MSLRVPRETLTVAQPTEHRGSEGQLTRGAPYSEPVTVRVNTYPLDATELELNPGLINSVTRRVYARDGWPADQYSRITYQGDTWEQVGPAVEYSVGMLTQHTQVTIRRVPNGV